MIGNEQNSSGLYVQGIFWEEHEWSQWYGLDSAIALRDAKAPEVPGLYRIRCANQEGLIYIGETGKSIRGRFRQLQKAMEYAEQGKYARLGKIGGPPHVAGGCVWNHKRAGFDIEVSWLDGSAFDRREIKGIECELIAAHRKSEHRSPACQFAGDLEAECQCDAADSGIDGRVLN